MGSSRSLALRFGQSAAFENTSKPRICLLSKQGLHCYIEVILPGVSTVQYFISEKTDSDNLEASLLPLYLNHKT